MKPVLTVIAVIIVVIIGSAIAFNIITPEKTLKVFKPSDINPRLVDKESRTNSTAHHIGKFELVDQQGRIITEKSLHNKIYVADFFFTTCPSICPDMSAQMKRIHEKFLEDKEVMLVSHTVMPETDTPEVLADYASLYGASPDKWLFLTGDKEKIYELARQSYFAVTSTGNGDEHDFIHTENFILIDKEKRIRGFYDGTDEKDIDRLMSEIEILKKAYIIE